VIEKVRVKRTIEIMLVVLLIGLGSAALLLTGRSDHNKSDLKFDPFKETLSMHLNEGSALNPADAVKLAPFLPTPMCVVEKMLEMAEVDKKDIVYDLGCGDGRIVITAAKKYGAHGVGLDIYPQWMKKSQSNARKAGVESLVKFRLQDATKADISEATVVTLYLLPESNDLLRPLLEKQLKPGARVVSHNYHIAGWGNKEVCVESLKDDSGNEHTVFVYRR
jgi:SAM-dependent methyltransferase